MSGNKLIKDYAWLIEGLRPYCDEVMTHLTDYDRRLAIGVRWGETQVALTVESAARFSDERPVHVNAAVAAGALSRADVILAFLAKRPGGVPATMGAK